jgi:hypothetical protein
MIALERFQAIARQSCQVSKARCSIQPIKTHLGLPRKTGKLLDCKPLGAPIPIAYRWSLASSIYDLRK